MVETWNDNALGLHILSITMMTCSASCDSLHMLDAPYFCRNWETVEVDLQACKVFSLKERPLQSQGADS